MKDNEQQLISKWVSSQEGRKAVEILRGEFYDVDSFDESPLEMAKIGGERRMVEYLIDLQED